MTEEEENNRSEQLLVELSSREVQELYEETRDKESVNIAIQMNDHHHHYTDTKQKDSIGNELATIHELNPELAQQFLDIIKKEQSLVVADQELDRAELEANQKDRERIRDLESKGLHYGALMGIVILAIGAAAMYLGHLKLSGYIFSLIIGVLTILVLRKRPKAQQQGEEE